MSMGRPMNTILQLILLFAVSGVALSGYWTWRGLTSEASKDCAAIAQAEIFLGYPLYTYGLMIYVLIVALVVAALWRTGKS
jgi:predicted cation transporter